MKTNTHPQKRYEGHDFYCDMVLSNKIKIKKELETDNVLAFYHTRPYWPLHIIVIPKKHINSLITLDKSDDNILLELVDVIKKIAKKVTDIKGEARVITNLGNYQDSKHLHFHIVSGEEY